MPMNGSAKEAAEAERLAAVISKRTEQLKQVKTATSRLNDAQKAMRAKSAARETLLSHLDGFYKEVDKLAKGKTLFQVTDMILEGTNSIVRDAKDIIDSDLYIDRVKEFVAAGENPVYPDILVVLRTIQQANERFKPMLEARRSRVNAAISEAETVGAAISIFIEGEGHVATPEEIEGHTGGWFRYSDEDNDGDGPLFDFERLDGLNVTEYLTTSITAGADVQE